MYMYIPPHRAAMVHRVPDRPTERTSDPLSSPSCSWPPFRPRKLIKVQLIKITYFSSIGGARWGRAVVEGVGKGCGRSGDVRRVCAPSTFFLRFCGASPSPALSRGCRVFPPLFLLFFLTFCDTGRTRRVFLLFKGGRGRYCSCGLGKYGRIWLLGTVARPPHGNFYGPLRRGAFFPSSCFSFVCRCSASRVSKRHRLHGVPHVHSLSLLSLFLSPMI